MLNPFEALGTVTPLISLSFRLWGNILAGEIVLAIIYTAIWNLTKSVPVLGTINFLGSVIAPVFHLYLDVVAAIIQGFIFVILTSIYWNEQKKHG
jgi:F-type H+-transporting ATPase subunit a